MELKDTCKVLLDKGNVQKLKCYKFHDKEIDRDLAIHEDVDHKNKLSVSDYLTGLRLFGLDKQAEKVKIEEVQERLETYKKHYTIEGIKKEFERLETDEK